MLSRATNRLARGRTAQLCYTTSTAPARATPLASAAAPSPPPPAPSSAAQQAQRTPQPFTPKPLARTWQISSLKPAPSDQGSATTIVLTSGSAERALTVPNLFLRDSSVHSSHVHPESRQKLFRTTDVPLGGEVVGFGVHEIAGEEHLVMEWTTAVEGVETKTAKLSVTPLSVLLRLIKGKRDGEDLPTPTPWTKEELDRRIRPTPYSEYKGNDTALHRTLETLFKDGIVLLEGVPIAEKEGHFTELRTLVERMSSVRRTWYGDLFDVKAEKDSKNIAYTNLDLGLHMDLTHFSHPPRYQFLQSLQNTGVTGGSSYFVDSFAVCRHLLEHHPSAFETLATEPMLFSYTSDSHATRFVRPVIELVEGSRTQIHAINYSPPFQGPLSLYQLQSTKNSTTSSDAERLSALHQALRLFADLCDSPSMRYERQLQPGDCVVFDNRRVLHARTAFTWDEGTGAEGGRWLKGAYCDGDEVQSKWRILEMLREKGKLR